jgi:hypothetical protein
MNFRLFFAAFLTASVLFSPAPVFAQADDEEDETVTDRVCDPDIFDRMRQKAWMEAQRENIATQGIITRPANTFALTCFDRQVGMAMNNGVAVNGNTTAYQNAVSNNAGGIAGGLIGGSGTMIPQPNGGSTNTSYNTSPTPTGSYSCNTMDQMWAAAQCSNMQGAMFPSLKEVSNDTRDYPQSCSTSRDDSGLYTYGGALGQIYATGASIPGFNNMSTHFCQTGPLSQVESANNEDGSDACPQQDGSYCWPGKKTGFKLDGSVDEITCSNPGCVPKLESGEMKCRPYED